MTPEPKDVQFARVIVNTLSENSEVYRQAIATIEAHEASLERGRRQQAERARQLEETARRWPELAADGWVFLETEYSFKFRHDELPGVAIKKNSGEFMCAYNDSATVDSSVITALIDAAGRNTTADRLRNGRS